MNATPPPGNGAAFAQRLNRAEPSRESGAVWLRLLLLALILAGFLRVMWGLDAQDLWWDESLSLQRAESTWSDVIVGRLPIRDGIAEIVTTDQHPFFFFVVAGVLIRLAGDSELVLRFPSVMATTLLIPLVWVWARRLVHIGALPTGTPLWAALLAAAHPFFLWYGQEARPYAMWAMLAMLSSYTLWRATQNGRRWWLGFAVSAAMFYTSHYYALFLLPVHALLLALTLWSRSRRWALITFVLLGTVGAAAGLAAYWVIIVRQGGGTNFAIVRWYILLPDLLNAFSMGPSANIEQFWWLDIVCGILAILGAGVSLRRLHSARAGGWLAPALVVAPVLALILVGQFIPAYMTARHMSLIGGGYIVLVAGGLALLTQAGRIGKGASIVCTILVLSGMAVSSTNYLTQDEYAKDDFTGLGAFLERRLAPGDLLLFESPFSWRALTYYTPLDTAWDAQRNGVPIAAYGVPLIGRDWEQREAQMRVWIEQHRRTWYIVSNTQPDMDPTGRTGTWLRETFVQLDHYKYFSLSTLSRSLILREIPVVSSLDATVPTAMKVNFGTEISLVDFYIDPAGLPPVDGLALPVTLEWQARQENLDRYKYILRLEEALPGDDAVTMSLSVTEREPYDGAIPTIYWRPDERVIEYTELPPISWPRPTSASDAARYTITLQVYHAETLEKLPVRLIDAGEYHSAIQADGYTLRLPYWPAIEPGR